MKRILILGFMTKFLTTAGLEEVRRFYREVFRPVWMALRAGMVGMDSG